MNFEINENTRVAGKIDFTNGIHKAQLIKVEAREQEKKNGSVVSILTFLFKDVDKREYEHVEWEVDADSDEDGKRMEGLKGRVGHIYTVATGKSAVGLGSGATSFKEFFNKISETFNFRTKKEGTEDFNLPVYRGVNLWIKLTYNKSGVIGFPLFPNFVERVVPNKETLLSMNRYDVNTPKSASANPLANLPDNEVMGLPDA